jgi:hypothetical protein
VTLTATAGGGHDGRSREWHMFKTLDAMQVAAPRFAARVSPDRPRA